MNFNLLRKDMRDREQILENTEKLRCLKMDIRRKWNRNEGLVLTRSRVIILPTQPLSDKLKSIYLESNIVVVMQKHNEHLPLLT